MCSCRANPKPSSWAFAEAEWVGSEFIPPSWVPRWPRPRGPRRGRGRRLISARMTSLPGQRYGS